MPALAEAFRPTVLVSQQGCDTHAWDPLAHLRVTTAAHAEAARLHRRGLGDVHGRPLARDGRRRLRRVPGGAPDVGDHLAHPGRPADPGRRARGVARPVGGGSAQERHGPASGAVPRRSLDRRPGTAGDSGTERAAPRSGRCARRSDDGWPARRPAGRGGRSRLASWTPAAPIRRGRRRPRAVRTSHAAPRARRASA